MNFSLVTTTWSLLAGLALAMGLVHALAWFQNRRDRASLCFSMVALAFSSIALLELGLMHTSNVEVYARALQWAQVPLFVLVAGLTGFIHAYFRTGWLPLGVAAVGMRFAALVLNFAVPPNLNFDRIISLRQVSFLGEHVWAIGEALPTVRVRVAELSSLLLLAYVAQASWQLWRQGGDRARPKAVILGGSLVFFILFAAGMGWLIHARLLQTPYFMSVPFVGIMLAMSYELSGNMIRAPRLLGELREAEREASQRREEVTRISRAITLSELSSAFAHELNQPLTAILANAQAASRLLEEPARNADELRAIVLDIAADDQRAAEVIRRLGATLKHEKSAPEEIRPAELLAALRHLIRHDYERRKITLESELPAGDLPRCFGDPVQLQQVLLNLLLNAADACAELEARRRVVRLTVTGRDGQVAFRVSDLGCGLPAAADRIFEPFFSTKPSGHGLGLAVSRTIARAHGGELVAEANQPWGAIFTLTVPAMR